MRELSTRQKSIDSLVRSATEQGDDTLKEQLAELVAHWKTVNQLAAQRKDRLEQLLAEAKMLDEGFKGTSRVKLDNNIKVLYSEYARLFTNGLKLLLKCRRTIFHSLADIRILIKNLAQNLKLSHNQLRVFKVMVILCCTLRVNGSGQL